MRATFESLWREEGGQDLAEYSVLMALIALAMIVLLIDFRMAIAAPIENVRDVINDAAAQPG